jgi:hypothetical protein
MSFQPRSVVRDKLQLELIFFVILSEAKNLGGEGVGLRQNDNTLFY